MERAEMQGGDYAKFKHAAVLEIIIIIYSQEICPFKPSFWSDILQIGLDIIY